MVLGAAVALALAGLDPRVREAAEAALAWAAHYRIPVTVTSGKRSHEKQAQLRAQYEDCLRRGERVQKNNPNPRCRYPANKPGDSSHEFGMSFDSWAPPEWMSAWVQLRRALGWRVPDNDVVHAEVPNWREYVR